MRAGWLIGVAVGLAPRVADACSFAPIPAHELDPAAQAVDTTPPSAIGETTYSVKRGSDGESDGCGQQSGSSCDGIGVITVHLGEATDDQAPAASLGYRIGLVDGQAPSGLTLPTNSVRADASNALSFPFQDDAEDDQEPIDFTIRIRAVDLAGNEGPPQDVRIRDDGSDGCRIAPHTLDLSWSLIVLALVFLRRR